MPARYNVHTPQRYAAVLLVLGVLAAVAAFFVLPLLPHLFDGHAFTLLGGLAVIALPVLYYAVTPEYRAGLSGQPSAITLSREFIEVPDTRGVPMRFATQGLTLRVTHIRVVYVIAVVPVADIPRGAVIELEGGGMRRRISTLTLIHEAHAPLLLHDLSRVLAGQDPLGPDQAKSPETAYRTAPRDAPQTQAAPERDALDDALDDELAKMD
jgi:hypothetical protein